MEGLLNPECISLGTQTCNGIVCLLHAYTICVLVFKVLCISLYSCCFVGDVTVV